MKCKNCSFDLPENAKFCTSCGCKAFDEPVEEKPQTVNCWNCGMVNETGATYCLDCGAKLKHNKLFVRVAAELTKKNFMDVCPRCRSRNIKLYRRGYDYKVGFWGAIFGVRGSGYAGGFDANKTCCRCMDCGKDWETDYDYRLINK